MKIAPSVNLNNLIAPGIIESVFGRIVLKQWSCMEGSFMEPRNRKIWIKMKNVPIYYWSSSILKKMVKGFGDLVMGDNLSENEGQNIETIVQVACNSLNDIPKILKACIHNNMCLIYV